MARIFSLIFFFILGVSLQATSDPVTSKVKEIDAIRIDDKPIIDGELEEHFIRSNFKADNFTTFEPIPGLPSEYQTEVTINYNDQAIFISAKLYDDNPESIIKDLCPRDRTTNTDFFGITFDPYQTGLTGYTFVVTAAGVQVDIKRTGDMEDASWNDVWKSAVKFDEKGWNVEMEIPYSALRFPTGEVNDWNIQLFRSVRSKREMSFWNPVDPEVDGLLTQMGTLKNIRNIDAPLRLSVTPYIGFQMNTLPSANGSVEFSPKMAGGLDLKYGINEAFTLDMILVPDFSQVRSDIQVLNLSPFEVQFNENRPFFTEGLELFSTANIFYTRRIGGNAFRRDEIANKGDFEEFDFLPNNNLINATKISGRTNSNVGLGFFNAVEIPTYATYRDTSGQLHRELANPTTNYNVSVVEKALKNNSKISLINTNVTRVGSSYDANVTGVEWNLRNNTQKYDVRGKYALSQKYFSDKTDLGYVMSLNAGKIQGAWTYRGSMYIESANYDINDLGFLRSPNEKNFRIDVNKFVYKPKNDKIGLLRWSNEIGYSSLYAPNYFTGFYLNSEYVIRLKSFDAFGLWASLYPLGYKDYFEPRTADYSSFLRWEPSAAIGGFISSDYRKPLAVDVRFNYEEFQGNERRYLNGSVAPRFRLNAKIFIVPKIYYEHSKNNMGYVFPDENSSIDPGENVLIGTRDINSFTNTINAQYNITNKMSLSWEISHYFSSVKYSEFGILNEDGNVNNVNYSGYTEDGISVHDRNYNFFTMNGVYVWRFAPGSDLIISYKTNLTQETEFRDYFSNVSQLRDFYKSSGLNIKALYFLDVNRVLKK